MYDTGNSVDVETCPSWSALYIFQPLSLNYFASVGGKFQLLVHCTKVRFEAPRHPVRIRIFESRLITDESGDVTGNQ